MSDRMAFRRNDLEVFKAVIFFAAVEVVDDDGGIELNTKCFFNNKAMLKNDFRPNSYAFIGVALVREFPGISCGTHPSVSALAAPRI